MCPLVIDQITRLDSAKAFPDHTIKHYYTLNTSKENVDLNMLKENVIKNTINEIQNNPQLKPFKGEKITYIQIYSDKDGNEISTITVKPEDYEKAQ